MKCNCRVKKLLTSIIVVLAFIIIGCGLYVSDYYVADDVAISAMKSDETLQIKLLDNENVVFHRDGNSKGLIFYPGGKVEYTAYAPLLRQLADNGITCILVKMPFNLAVLDMNAADGIQEQFNEINQWYIGGHSLGGSMAATYASKHPDEFQGLILFASYSVDDLVATGLDVYSVYGSEDGVLDMNKYENYKVNFPTDYQELVIQGG